MSPVASLLIGEALKIALPILAEQIVSLASENEPKLKAILGAKLGHANPLVEEIYQLLIEPGLVTLGHLLIALGSATPTAQAAAEPAPQPAEHKPWPQYNDD